MGIKRHGNMNYLVYDEISVITELNVEILSEVLYANFIQLTV
jgi:isocitrate dehydrogenase kinase/phosphatase